MSYVFYGEVFVGLISILFFIEGILEGLIISDHLFHGFQEIYGFGAGIFFFSFFVFFFFFSFFFKTFGVNFMTFLINLYYNFLFIIFGYFISKAQNSFKNNSFLFFYKEESIFWKKISIYTSGYFLFFFLLCLLLFLFNDVSFLSLSEIEMLLTSNFGYGFSKVVGWFFYFFLFLFYHLSKFDLDGVSLVFLVLTSFLFFLSFVSSWNHFNYCYKEFYFLFIFMEILLFYFFSVTDLFLFYIFFEGILLPLFILIGVFGSRQRKIHASFQLFFYTLIGSFFMLFSIIYLQVLVGTTDFFLLLNYTFPLQLQLIFWLFFFFSLSVKVPLFPFHIWLPEAHVEAPTVGSVILAGILLKMGGFGMFRFVIPLFPFANWYFCPLVQTLCFLAIVYISIVTLCQIDLKKLIAYSSVAHMGYATLALFVNSNEGFLSSIFLMLNHGIVSSLLFFLIGIIYDRYKTRLVFYYQSLAKYMPLYKGACFFAMLANIGFPGTSSFIAEFLVMFSFFSFNKLLVFYNGLGLIFSAFYSFWLYNRIFFGSNNNFLSLFSDLTIREFIVLFSFVSLILFYGFFPGSIFLLLYYPIVKVLYHTGFSNFLFY